MCVHLATECMQQEIEDHVLCDTQDLPSHFYHVLPCAPAPLFPLSPAEYLI